MWSSTCIETAVAWYLRDVHEVVVHQVFLHLQCDLDSLQTPRQISPRSWDCTSGALSANKALRITLLAAQETLASWAYLHLWYLCDGQHATDEEAGQHVVVCEIFSHPDLHLAQLPRY